jgi:hypothetical protein
LISANIGRQLAATDFYWLRIKSATKQRKGFYMPIDRVVVDFEQTFGKGIFLGIEPKMSRENKADPKSKQVQARDAEGILRWTATIAVKPQAFEAAKMENIAVTINSPQKPYERMPVGALVIVERLEMGIMRQDRGGYSTFFSAVNIRPAPQERVASGQ